MAEETKGTLDEIPADMEATQQEMKEIRLQQIEEACSKIISLRQRPLLLLYYPGPYGNMLEEDVRYCYQAFRNLNITIEERLQECDVLIHTLGGDPIAAYKLGQVVRDLVSNVICLVPEHAYSAGTLFCFCANEIRLGHYAGLSPIDITQEEVELASIDNYKEFAQACHAAIQKIIRDEGERKSVTVGSDLLCQLVQQVGALNVGKYYRARTLTGHYAQELLDRYMLAGLPNAKGCRNKIIRKLLLEAPSHEFHLDFHMCVDLGLQLTEMSTTESDVTKNLVSLLDSLAFEEIICPSITDELKMPFIALYK